MATVVGFDARDLAESGWGVVFPQEINPAVREALRPLLEHRRERAAALREDRYRELELRPAEDLDAFLIRHGRAPGPVHPGRMPYYLLLVGDPSAIPFKFQTGLDVQHAVGRICFPTLEEYERYARAVVAAESGGGARDRLVDFFAPRNANDPATELSSDHLITPLANRLEGTLPGWRLRRTLGERATRQALIDILGGEEGRPALLFAASHGLGFPPDHPEQFERQGALLCQDWPGPGNAQIAPEWSFAAADLSDRADVAGLVVFLFACYGAGTPELDDFAHRNDWRPRRIAPCDFVARLPQRLLERGALAVIAHLERAWAYSFLWQDEAQVDVFESTLKLILDGWPVGAAMEYLNQRYAELATLLAAVLRRAFSGESVDEREVARLWTAHNDARGYVIIGDPAATLTPLATHSQERGTRELPYLASFDTSVSGAEEDKVAEVRRGSWGEVEGTPVRSCGRMGDREFKSRRRHFSLSYKLRILQEADVCQNQGELAELLRREGLHGSYLNRWRTLLRLDAPNGPQGDTAHLETALKRIRELERENESLRNKLLEAKITGA